MVYRVRILPGALQDAREYYTYIAEDSPTNAARWFDGLLEVIDSLSTLPKRCPVAPESNMLEVEVRCLLYSKFYRILYVIEKDVVRIYHIRHTSQQPMTAEEFFLGS